MTDWKSSPVMGIVLILAIIISGWFIYRSFKTPTPTYSEIVICTNKNCGHIFKVTFKKGKTQPFLCPKCGEKKAYLAIKCYECGEIFPSMIPNPKEGLECPNPHCGSKNVHPLREIPEEAYKPFQE